MKPVTPLRVGLLVIAALALLLASIGFVRKGALSSRSAQEVHAWFKDATGIGKRSRVQVAGIPVGEVAEVKLEGTRAHVVLRLRKDVSLRQDAALTKRSESLLGDYLLELYLGSDEAPPLEEGGTISRVVDQQGMDAVFGSLEQITGDIREVTRSLRDVLGGPQGQGALQQILDNLVRLSASLDQVLRRSAERLEVILAHVQGASASVKAITEEQREPIREVMANVEAITRDVRELVGSARALVSGDGGQPLGDSAATLQSALEKLDRGLANVEALTEGVKEGKGLAGTLLTDSHAAQRLNETLDDVSNFASRLTQLRLEVGIRSDYLVTQGQAKSYLQLRMIPRPDKFYLLEVVDDPRGTVETVTVQASPPAAGDPALQVQRTTRQGLKFSAQVARRYYFATLRLGIIENTGGLGADLHFFQDALSLRLDAFDFSVNATKSPRVRAALRLQAFDHLFATVGVDDLANAPRRDGSGQFLRGRDFFVGGGVFFTDEDLQALLTVSPLRP